MTGPNNERDPKGQPWGGLECPGCGNPLQKGSGGAYLCESGGYRYFLQAPTGYDGDKTCLFVMLNPGTEQGREERKNHTTRDKCVGFAAAWGHGVLWTCNLFAIGGTNPKEALQAEDPVGLGNDMHIRRAVRLADRVVLGWGRMRSPRRVWRERTQEALRILNSEMKSDAGKLYVLDHPSGDPLTRDGQPRHPRDPSLLSNSQWVGARRVVIERIEGTWGLRVSD